MNNVAATTTVTATQFKATCLEMFDRLASRELARVTVTKRGKVVAVLTPPEAEADGWQAMLEAMKGSVIIPDDLDLTEPVFEGTMDADLGILHR